MLDLLFVARLDYLARPDLSKPDRVPCDPIPASQEGPGSLKTQGPDRPLAADKIRALPKRR